MNSKRPLSVPFFECGPKAYLYGKQALDLALCADKLSVEFGIDIIFDPQTVDIALLASNCPHLHIFAQHADGISPGRGQGAILPEALKAAGASGVLLNHTEKQLTLAELEKVIIRCDESGLITMVCADNVQQALAIAHFSPDIIVVESPELIGGGSRSQKDIDLIKETGQKIRAINPNIKILHGAAIKNAQDVYDVIAAGSDASGSSSAIAKADKPATVLREMVEAVKQAWEARQ